MDYKSEDEKRKYWYDFLKKYASKENIMWREQNLQNK